MHDGRSVERRVDDGDAPPRDMDVGEPPLHRGVGKVAERVIEEMREDVGEHHQTAGEAHLPHANTAHPRRKLRRARARRAEVTDRGPEASCIIARGTEG